MENRINQVIKIDEYTKYLILRQAIYNNDNYFVCVRLIDNELSEDFELLHEIKDNGNVYVELVTEEKTYNLLLRKLGLLD
ncbi:MAG: hypothetical protein IJZ36_03185 [Bacilli bacterium]|nr:hypothetical protein [Bacilli bacterium]